MTIEERIAALEEEVAELRTAVAAAAAVEEGGVLEGNHRRFMERFREREMLAAARRRAVEGGDA